jgi:hypothetical protein
MKIKLAFLFFLFCGAAMAQSPTLINYQGIARGSDGQPVTDQAMGIKFEILQGTPSGSLVFTETQPVTTSSLGMIQTTIGLNGNLGNINWQNGPYFLQVSLDALNDNNFIQLGVQRIMSVPFSMHAESVPATYTASSNQLTIGKNTFTLSSTPVTTITATGIASVSTAGTNTFALSVPEPTYTPNGPVTISGTYPNYTVNAPVTPTVVGTGMATVTVPATNSFVVNVPQPSIAVSTTPGAAGVSQGVNAYTINIPAGITPTINPGGVLLVTPLTTGNNFTLSVPGTSITQSGAAVVTTAGTNTFNVHVPQTLVTQSGVAQVTTAGTNTFNVNVPGTSVTQGGVALVTTAGTNTFNVSVPGTSVTQGGVAVVTTAGTNTFNVSVPGTSVTQGGVAVVTTAGTNTFNVSVPGTSVTQSGAALVTSSGTNTFNVHVPTSTVTQGGVAVVTSAGTNSFNVSVPGTSLTQGGVVAITPAGTNTFNISVPGTSVTQGGVAVVTTAGTNTFNVSVPGTSVTQSGAAQITSSGTNTFNVHVPTSTITQSGAVTVTSAGTNSFNINVPTGSVVVTSVPGVVGYTSTGTNSVTINVPPAITPTITATGIAQQTTSGNSFTVDVTPLTYTASTGSIASGTNIVNITQSLTLSGGTLTSGPVTNSIDLSGITPWIQTASTVALATSSAFVGIGTNTPTAILELDAQGSSNFGMQITNARDVIGGALPLHILLNTAGQTYGTNTFGRAMRMTHSVTTSAFDFGFNSNGDFFLARLNSYNPPHMVFTTTGKTGVGALAPTENLQVESTANSSLSIISGATNTSDLYFGTSVNHSLGRIRYINSSSNLSFWTNSTSRFSIDGNGVGLFGPSITFAGNTAMTISRGGAFNTQVIIPGGDNSNSYGGILSLGENINPTQGMSLRLEAGGNKLYITNDLAGNSPVVGIGGYSGQPNGMAIGTGFAGAASPADGLIVQGNTGIGSSSPGTRLEVIGDISIPNGNKIQFGTNGSGSGIGEWIQNSGSGLDFRTASLSRVSIINNGNVGIGTAAPQTNLHVNGMVRMGSETGTSQPPSYPNNGMIVRRVISTGGLATTPGSTVATTPEIAFERDGSFAGFRVNNYSTSLLLVCNCMGVNALGASVNRVYTNLAAGTTQVFTNADNVVYFHCMFGDPFYSIGGNITEVTLTRQHTDYYWLGHIVSTQNQ